MLAGIEVRNLIVEHVNSIGNVVNLERNAQAKFNEIQWAIQANEDRGQV